MNSPSRTDRGETTTSTLDGWVWSVWRACLDCAAHIRTLRQRRPGTSTIPARAASAKCRGGRAATALPPSERTYRLLQASNQVLDMIGTLRIRNSFRARTLVLAPAFFLAIAAYGQQPAGLENFPQGKRRFVSRRTTDRGKDLRASPSLGSRRSLDLREFDEPVDRRKEDGGNRRYEVRECSDAGNQYTVPAVVAKALSVLNQKDAGPVFVHCRRGADRTGTIVACYRISHDGWQPAEALA